MRGAAMQWDIFERSRDVMLRNGAMQALERCDATAARMACERLAREYPLDMSRQALLVLAGAIEAGDRNRFRGHDALRQARQALPESIQPVARRTLGDKGAAAWLGRLWQDFAQRAERLTFDAEYADDHAGAAVAACGPLEGRRRGCGDHRIMAPDPGAAGLDGRGPVALGRGAGDLADAGGGGGLIAPAPGGSGAAFSRPALCAMEPQVRSQFRGRG